MKHKKSNSVIFIGSSRLKKASKCITFRSLYRISPKGLAFRVFASFIPPLTKKYRKIFVDLLGPTIALLSLIFLATYGCSLKQHRVTYSPTYFVATFSFLMPVMTFLLLKVGRSAMNFLETLSLVGYSLYGHISTLLVSLLCYEGRSNAFFFLCLIIFDGLSTLRLTLICMKTIPLAAARLLICCSVSVINILFTIYLHFAFMHILKPS